MPNAMLAGAALALLCAGAAAAQSDSLASPVAIPRTAPALRNQAVRIVAERPVSSGDAARDGGPLGLDFGLEYERRIARRVSLGLSWSYRAVPRADAAAQAEYYSAEVQLRFYPGGRPLEGLWVGPAGGWAMTSSWLGTDRSSVPRASGLVAGADVGYGRLLGADRSYTVDLGLGFRHVFLDGTEYSGRDYPAVRFGFGIAF